MHICLVNLPRYEVNRPPLSLAVLSAICDSHQVDYSCVDLSLLIWQKLQDDFYDIDNFCITNINSVDYIQFSKKSPKFENGECEKQWSYAKEKGYGYLRAHYHEVF